MKRQMPQQLLPRKDYSFKKGTGKEEEEHEDSALMNNKQQDTVKELNSNNNSPQSSTSATLSTGISTGQQRVKIREHPRDFLPPYLYNFLEYGHGDFFYCLSFAPRLLTQLMFEGFLPIANSRYLLPKLHKERCVIYPLHKEADDTQETTGTNNKTKTCKNNNNASSSTPSCVHISKSTKKKAKRFSFSINKDFDGVVKGCHVQHGISWLYPPIVQAFKVIHEQTKLESHDGVRAKLIIDDDDDGTNTSMTANQQKQQFQEAESFPVRLFSVEVWNNETNKLVAGELGYSIGTVYTSLTGFSSEDSAGSVQLAALGHLLGSIWKFDMWDLGMELGYKLTMGAHCMERANFVDTIKVLRTKTTPEGLVNCSEKQNCKEILLLKG